MLIYFQAAQLLVNLTYQQLSTTEKSKDLPDALQWGPIVRNDDTQVRTFFFFLSVSLKKIARYLMQKRDVYCIVLGIPGGSSSPAGALTSQFVLRGSHRDVG